MFYQNYSTRLLFIVVFNEWRTRRLLTLMTLLNFLQASSLFVSHILQEAGFALKAVLFLMIVVAGNALIRKFGMR